MASLGFSLKIVHQYNNTFVLSGEVFLLYL